MAGPEDEKQATLFPDSGGVTGILSIAPEQYLGKPIGQYEKGNLRKWGLDPSEGPLTRHSYLYQAEYPINKGPDGSEWGTIELRARTWTYSADIPESLKTIVKQTAHRAATLFNSAKQTGDYVGYLDGFNSKKVNAEWNDPTTSWEDSVVGGASAMDAQAGRVDWNTEIYLEDGRLSGIAQGLSHPWTTETTVLEREPPRSEFRLKKQPKRGEYEIKPAPNTGQSARAKNVLPGKAVYINDKPVGTWRKARGTAAIKRDYTRPPEINGRQVYDRERLIDETKATAQALRDGGKLYKTEETETAIYFVTAQHRPETWEPTDPDEIDPDDDAATKTTHRLRLRTESEPSKIEARRDETVIRHLGLSLPPYEHDIAEGWRA